MLKALRFRLIFANGVVYLAFLSFRDRQGKSAIVMDMKVRQSLIKQLKNY